MTYVRTFLPSYGTEEQIFKEPSMKTLFISMMLLTSAVSAYADATGIMECFSKTKQLSLTLETYEDNDDQTNDPIAAQIIQNDTGGPVATGKDVFLNYDDLKVTKDTSAERIYMGPDIKLTVAMKQGARKVENGYSGINRLVHVQAATVTGEIIDTYLRCDM
jgi:hypothetical protein